MATAMVRKATATVRMATITMTRPAIMIKDIMAAKATTMSELVLSPTI